MSLTASTGDMLWECLMELRPIADAGGFGGEWSDMVMFRTEHHCARASDAALAACLRIGKGRRGPIFEAAIAANAARRAVHTCKSVDAIVEEAMALVEAARKFDNQPKETTR